MKKTIYTGTFLFFVLTACSGGGSTYDEGNSVGDVAESVDQQSYEEVQQSAQEVQRELKERESDSPVDFLSIEDGTYRKNIFGEFVLEGYIANNAQEASFKDAVIEIKFYTKTDTYLGSKRESIIEYFDPQKRRSFKLKVFGPDDAASVGFEVVDASPAE